MARQPAYSPGPDIPQDEILHDRQGRIIDDDYAEAAAAEAIAAVGGRGRPSLSRSGESPLLRVRLSRELNDDITRAAEQAGTSRADWVRHALAQAARKPADTQALATASNRQPGGHDPPGTPEETLRRYARPVSSQRSPEKRRSGRSSALRSPAGHFGVDRSCR
jgi:hypothetical protein